SQRERPGAVWRPAGLGSVSHYRDPWFGGKGRHFTPPGRPGPGGPWGLAAEQLVELAAAVERHEVLVAPDMEIADVDLRHGAPSGAFHHRPALRRLEIHANLR